MKPGAIASMGIVLGILASVALSPARYHVERRVVVSAPGSATYPLLADLSRFPEWSPWAKLDPQMKTSLSRTKGKGATYTWEGNDQAGKGTMTIVDLAAPARVDVALELLAPRKSRADVRYTLAQRDDGKVEVLWSMDGHFDLMGRLHALFVDMDGVIGPDLERGLANLKTLAEREARQSGAAVAGTGGLSVREAMLKAMLKAVKESGWPNVPPGGAPHAGTTGGQDVNGSISTPAEVAAGQLKVIPAPALVAPPVEVRSKGKSESPNKP